MLPLKRVIHRILVLGLPSAVVAEDLLETAKVPTGVSPSRPDEQGIFLTSSSPFL